MAMATGFIDPLFRRPPPQQRKPDAPQSPTFQSPAAPQPDPRIAELTRQLQMGDSGTPQQAAPTRALPQPLNLSGVDQQGEQLQSLLSELMRGGTGIRPDMANDPEARAFRVAREREGERQRESEAARLAASGASGSGDFDSRVAQIRESVGQDVAGNTARLTGERRREMLDTAMAGAGLQMSDLDRQARNRAAEFGAGLDTERVLQGRDQLSAAERAANQASQQRLLEVLLGQGAQQRAEFESDRAFNRADIERQLREELLRQEVETGKRQLATSGSSRLRIGGVSAPPVRARAF